MEKNIDILQKQWDCLFVPIYSVGHQNCLNCRTAIGSSNFTPGSASRGKQFGILKRFLHVHVYWSTIPSSKRWNQFRCSSAEIWVKRLWYIRTAGHSSGIKKNELIIYKKMIGTGRYCTRGNKTDKITGTMLSLIGKNFEKVELFFK